MLHARPSPNDAAQMLGWLKASVDLGASPKRRSLFDALRERWGAEPASAIEQQGLDAALRAEIFELLVAAICLNGTLAESDLAMLERFNRTLARPTPWPRILRLGRSGRSKLATLALSRVAPDGKALLRAVWRDAGVRGVVNALRSSFGRGPADAELASRYAALASAPDDSLGRAFFVHMRARGLPLPGERGSLPELAMHHDLMHVITGFDTDARGEARLAGFYNGAVSRHPVVGGDAFAFIIVALMTFELGYDIGPTFVRPERGAIDPIELIACIDAGARTQVDVLGAWNFREELTQPLRRARARLGIHPDGFLATG